MTTAENAGRLQGALIADVRYGEAATHKRTGHLFRRNGCFLEAGDLQFPSHAIARDDRVDPIREVGSLCVDSVEVGASAANTKADDTRVQQPAGAVVDHQRSAAIALARVFAALAQTGSNHVVSDKYICRAIGRIGRVVRHDRYHDFLQNIGSLPAFGQGAPARDSRVDPRSELRSVSRCGDGNWRLVGRCGKSYQRDVGIVGR